MSEIRLNNLGYVLLTFAVAIIIATVAVDIVTTIKADQYTTTSIANESFTASSSSYVSLNYIIKSVSAVWNGTNLLTEGTDYNWTAGDPATGSKGGIIVSASFDGLTLTVDYTGYESTTASQTSAKGEEGILKFANYLPTIGLVIATIVLITILIRSFGGRSENNI